MRTFQKITTLTQIVIGVLAIGIAIYALHRTNEVEKFSLESVCLNERLSCLRTMVSESANVRFGSKFAASTGDSKHTRMIKLFGSATEYERIFFVYGDCLERNSSSIISMALKELKKIREDAIQHILDKKEQEYQDSGGLQKFVDSSSNVAKHMESIPKAELESLAQMIEARVTGKVGL